MKIISTIIPLAFVATLSSGCATIVKDANQPIQIETYSKNNQMVSGAKCTAKNERGEWTTTSTGIVNAHRSADNLVVTCNKVGEATGHATLVSRANGGMFGNILLGGGIGAIIDHNKGTAYSYPDWIRVILGDNLIFDRKNNKDNEVMLGSQASSEELKAIADAKLAEEKAAKEKAEQEKASASH